MDIFGSTDPKKMPEHLFFCAFAVHHETAVRANIEKQNYGVCPRHWYIDAEFKCPRCGKEFTWTAGEQKTWFEEYLLSVDAQPRHCWDCRAELRRLVALRKEYDATVAAARDHGTPDQKNRIIEIVSELRQVYGELPERMTATLELFERQNKRAEPGGAANAAPPHR
jgi:predicted RNA-binding Zn-ribbon protein involved in translation (DUF1610 family)